MVKSYVVAVSIEKVQSFLFNVLHEHVQEKQSNNNTLKTIIQSSNIISSQFYNDLGIEGTNGRFSGVITEELLKCSGKCVFIVTQTEEKIMSELDGLFCEYYKKFSGQLVLKYVCFEENNESNKLKLIRKSNLRLKEKACLNNIIKRNQDLVFNFHKKQEGLFYRENDLGDKYNSFVLTINALYSDEDSKNSNRFRTAVIKADLDGMGELFKSLTSYETYSKVSQILSTYICLDSLHDQVQLIQQKEKDFRLFPLYIAGDDIFFAVPISQLMQGIYLCRMLLRQINLELEQIVDPLGHKLEQLTMSIGIDFTYNREPIRYYYERVQVQLENHAKIAAPLKSTAHIVPSSCIKVSINGQVLYLFDLPEEYSSSNKEKNSVINTQLSKYKEKFNDENIGKLYWNYLINDVKRLQQAEEHGFAVHHFLYSLLTKITDPIIKSSSVKYSNAVLYHMLPQYLTDSNQKLRNLELAIINSILKKLIETDQKGRNGVLCFEEKHKIILEGYIRLLLLFSDQRFNIVAPKEQDKHSKKDDKDKQAEGDLKKFAASAKSTLFNKGMKYLYDNNLKRKNKLLTSLFVEFTTYQPQAGNKVSRVGVYRTLRLSQSLLHQLKDQLKKSAPSVDIAEIIESANPETLEDIKLLEQECTKDYKAPPKLYFDKKAFKALQNSKPNAFNSDFIDSLLVFYLLKEQKFEFKSIYKSKVNKKYSGGKRH